jgi:1-acyl-sn-glycerol-3-phosphate acyltransferase
MRAVTTATPDGCALLVGRPALTHIARHRLATHVGVVHETLMRMDSAHSHTSRVARSVAARVWAVYALGCAVSVAASAWVVIVVLPLTTDQCFAVARVAGEVIRRAVGIELEITGGLPNREPVVIVANHPSFIDGLVLMLVVRKPVRLLAGAVFARQRIIGRLLGRLGFVFVGAGSPTEARGAIRHLVELLGTRHSVAAFPEGGIERSDGLGTFHLGAFRAAADANVRVVPVGIIGTRVIVPAGRRLPRRGPIRVVIGEPIAPSGDSVAEVGALRDAVHRAVGALIA